MKSTSFKTLSISGALLLFGLVGHTQEGHVKVKQDPEISNLLKLKKEINANEPDGDRYKISIFSGSRSSAENAQNGYNNVFSAWPSIMEYEPPNYKVYVGNFRNTLERDRALRDIKKKFPNAFSFKY
ncbi:hypothetical protein [Lacinutrix sp. Hel_I_90]|uniref:hypothetical protein n=1 Tax=Lacinutrix sp. Hel_I_90 TaxID=1249999 RepID=UPI0005C83C25|nr:hypothetical protein [Lacinutrix sp. Hel_I_90]